MMNTWCSNHVEDTKSWIKTFVWKVFILLVTIRNCITVYRTKSEKMFYNVYVLKRTPCVYDIRNAAFTGVIHFEGTADSVRIFKVAPKQTHAHYVIFRLLQKSAGIDINLASGLTAAFLRLRVFFCYKSTCYFLAAITFRKPPL